MKHIHIRRGLMFLVFFAVLFILSLFSITQDSHAYNQLGGGICECNTCDDCELAIADDVNCTDTVLLTAHQNLESPTCINNPNGNNKTFDCQDYVIEGVDDDVGILFNGSTGGDNIIIQNCNVNDWNVGIMLSNGTYTVQQNTITSNATGITALNNTLITILENLVYNNQGLGIQASSNTSSTISGNEVKWTETVPTSYHISQFSNGYWEERYIENFSTKYETKKFLFFEDRNELKLRFVQQDYDFGDIESIKLDACGKHITPKYAQYVESKVSVLSEIMEDDLDVIVAHEMPVEVAWDIPPLCSLPLVVSLNANEYGKGLPLLFPDTSKEEYVSYAMGTNDNQPYIDGKIDDKDTLRNPNYHPIWVPGTGHPKGETFVYISDDKDNVYLTFDVTADNTNEYGEDWIEVEVLGKGVFRIDDFNTMYGKCGFGNTIRVPYKHQMCEFSIPKKEIGYSDFEFKVRYYGTGAVPVIGSGILIGGGTQTLTSNVVNENAGYGILIENLPAGTIAINSNEACSNVLGDIYGYNMSPVVTGDDNECNVTNNWNDDGAAGCTYVCDDTPPVFVQIPGSTQVINLVEGQDVTVNPFTIRVKPEDPESGITRVEFYIDGELICTVTTPDANGVYSCDWDTSKYHSIVRVVAYNGNTMLAQMSLTANVALSATGQRVTLWVLLGMLFMLLSLTFLRIKATKEV
jgi:hypothetical protein